MNQQASKSQPRASRRRVRAFRLVSAVLLPLLLLFMAEITLRLCGFGVPMTFVTRDRAPGGDRYLSNPFFTWQFFDPRIAKAVAAFSLPVSKSPGTYRIFFLGGSACKGTPTPAYGIPRMLEVMLREQYPRTRFEVVNAGAVALNSHAVRLAAESCAKRDADLLVVYVGNNEVIGAYGPGTVLSPARKSAATIRADLWLRRTRLAQLIRDRLLPLRVPLTWEGMEMFLDRHVRASDPRLDVTYRHFEQNLHRICDTTSRAGIPLILSTVAVNVRHCAPFGSQHRVDLSAQDLNTWNHLYAEGIALAEEHRYAEAILRYLQAEQVDSEHAELQFRLGRGYMAGGAAVPARERYARALHLDTLRFRADGEINGAIRRAAKNLAADDVHLADAAAAAALASPNRLVGNELFLDHVHLNLAGTHLVAACILEQIESVLPPEIRAGTSEPPVPTRKACASALVFTDVARHKIATHMLDFIDRPPFTGQIDHAAHVARFTEELQAAEAKLSREALEQVAAQYVEVLRHADAHWLTRRRYAMLTTFNLVDYEEAERQWRHLVAELPQDSECHSRLGEVLGFQGKHAESELHLRTALRYRPGRPLILSNLASALQAQGKSAEAIRILRRALKTAPESVDVLYNLGVCLLKANPASPKARQQAREHWKAVLRLSPTDEGARRAIAMLHMRQAAEAAQNSEGWLEGRHVEQAVRISPDLANAHRRLVELHHSAGNKQAVLKHLKELRRIKPSDERVREAIESLASTNRPPLSSAQPPNASEE